MAFIGGFGTLWGTILGALALEPVQQVMTLRLSNSYASELIWGTLFLLVIMFLSRGVLPVAGEKITTWRGRRARRLTEEGPASARRRQRVCQRGWDPMPRHPDLLIERLSQPAAAALIAASGAAVVAAGSVEQHGGHLPLGTDAFAAASIAERVAARLGTVVASLGPGVAPYHLPWPGTLSLRRPPWPR